MVALRILFMTLSFLGAWSPFGCLYAVPLLGIQEKRGPVKIINALPVLILKLVSAIINPLLYKFENSEVRSIKLRLLLLIEN